MFVLYNILLTILAPLWLPWMWIRTRLRKVQPNWKERTGVYDIHPLKTRERVWFHAVSVGEVVAALPILDLLRKKLPRHEIILSTTTSSGHATALDKASSLVDKVVYFPIDVARFQLGAIQRVQPSVVAIMETELWFNFLWAAKVFDCRTMMINGRISDRSFRRSEKIKFFYRTLLKEMDRCLMQTAVDRVRIEALGGQIAEVFGNCKFDQAAANLDADPTFWRTELGLDSSAPIVVIGSTRDEAEEDLVIAAIPPDVQVVYAPRHVERAGAVAEKLRAKLGAATLRSAGGRGPVVVLDTYGELDKVYSAADLVIIGGGFSNLGGQNLIQPLALGKPVLHGPHMQNFRDVTAMSLAVGASRVCADSASLASAIENVLANPSERRTMGEAARKLVQDNLGASERYAQAIADEALAFRPT